MCVQGGEKMRVLRNSIAAAAVLSVFSSLAFGTVIVSDDGLGWTAVSSLGGAAWADGGSFNQNLNTVWSSALPGDGTGVAFEGPITQGYLGPNPDDRITESTDFVSGGGIVAGNYTAADVFAATFNFYNESATYQPSELALYFTDGVYEWYHNFTALPSQDWTPYTAYFVYGANWVDVSGSPGDDATNFGAALTGVTELGIRILYDNNLNEVQQYGFRNFQLHDSEFSAGYVPEPGTYVMLSTVLMSLGFTFGRKKKQVVA